MSSIRRTLPAVLVGVVVATGLATAHGGGHGATPTPSSSGDWVGPLSGVLVLVAVPTASLYWRRAARSSVGRAHAAAAALATVTAAVHVYLFVRHGEVVMLLAGLGFLAGVAAAAFLDGRRRRALYLLGVPYTLLQVALWLEAGTPHLASFGLLDKLAQVALVVLLVGLYRTDGG